MNRIRILPPAEAERIAAGEVVERPAAVVRELVENALDAGAARVRIQVEDGGLRRIKVADDGHGMAPEDARLALRRHATSKITCLDDLEGIATFGFRGEALPSIAAVSRLTLESAAGAQEPGIRLVAEAGEVRREEMLARPRGTTVTVDDLFFNTPARQKFLKRPPAEFARISETLLPEMLARPAVAFQLSHGERTSVDVAPAGDLRDRVAGIWGARLAGELLILERGAGDMQVAGLVSGPGETRASRRGWHLFVNGRPVKDPLLLHAAGEGISGAIPRGRYPLLFLFLEVPGGDLDVNVHPAKTEVRFADRGAVFALVRAALKQALAPAGVLQRSYGTLPEAPAGGGEREWQVSESAPRDGQAAAPAGEEPLRPPAGLRAAGPMEETASLLADMPPPVVLAQYRDCFIVAHDAEAFFMLDQHAAHERVLYEEIRAEFAERAGPTQALLFPATLPLPRGRGEGLEGLLPTLLQFGYLVEPFGEDSLMVREVPARLSPQRALAALADMIEILVAGDTPGADEAAARERLEHRLAATMACHAAVRLHDTLTRERMGEIVQRWLRCREPLTCPHGRTAVVRWPHGQLLKSFGRA